MWQAGPSWSTVTSSVSPSQSSRTSTTRWRWPEVSPLTQYSWRDRLQYVARPVVSVRCSASSSIQPSISTSPVSCCCTTAATSPSALRLSRAAMAGSSAELVAHAPPVSAIVAAGVTAALLGDPARRAGRRRRRRPRRTSSACGPRWTTRPRSTTTTSSAFSAVESRCAMVTAGAAASSAARGRGRSASPAAGSTALVASSRTSRSGSARWARSSATSWRSPADSDSPRWPTRVSRPVRQPVEPVAEAELGGARRASRRRWRRGRRSARWRASVTSKRKPSCGTSTTRRRSEANSTVAHVDAVEQHRARRRVHQPGEQLGERRLARAGLADDRDPACRTRCARSTSRSTSGPPG